MKSTFMTLVGFLTYHLHLWH